MPIASRSALEKFGSSQRGRRPEEFQAPNLVFRMGVPPVRIEVLTGVTGVIFEDCYGRRTIADVDGVRVNFISRGDLITNKRAAGRHKDLNDLEHL